jgi:phospholipase C
VLNSDADHTNNVTWPTFPERLEDLGVSWKIYQNEVGVGVGFTTEEDLWLSNFGDNSIEYFTQFNVRLTPAHLKYLEASVKSLPREIAALQRQAESKSLSNADAAKLADLIEEKSKLLQEIQIERQRCNQQAYDRLTPREKNLLTKAFCTNTGDPDYRRLTEISYQDGNTERQVNVPKGDLLHQFRQDVADGTLPTVSWLVAPEKFSDHPDSAWYGAWYIAELLDILTQNPAVWKKTVFILTYDENDGYFDHVPPFVTPDPRRPETGRVSKNIDAALDYVTREDEMKRKSAGDSRDSSIGLGYRVPMVIASPWSRGGCVCSQVFDHTSPLQFVEQLLTKKLGKEVRETNISQWRRTVCGDLTSAFQPASSDRQDRLPFPTRDEFIEQIHRAKFKELPSGYKKLAPADIEQIRRSPSTFPQLPRQEPGVRPSSALPYELAVEGKLTADRKQFALVLEARNERFGDRAAGSPFVVYARYKDGDVRTRDYAVSPGDRLEDAWSLDEFPDGHYHLAVYGPNGFFREFRGDRNDPPLEIILNGGPAAAAANAPASSDVEIHVKNLGEHPLDVEVADFAYKSEPQRATIAPGAAASLSVSGERSFGWYDLGVRAAGNTLFSNRYAGRVETGKPSFSDPAMGGTIS